MVSSLLLLSLLLLLGGLAGWTGLACAVGTWGSRVGGLWDGAVAQASAFVEGEARRVADMARALSLCMCLCGSRPSLGRHCAYRIGLPMTQRP